MQHNDVSNSSRRSFLSKLATGAAAVGATTLVAPLSLSAHIDHETSGTWADADEWFKKLKGKHKMVFDATQPHGIFPFAWPRVFMMTNSATGTPEKECGVVVVLRHDAIGYAMKDNLWAKYKLGELFKAEDPATKAPAVRNPFWQPKPGDFKVPGIGNVAVGINELQDSGVMFCVCNAAITVYSAAIADGMGLKAEDVKQEWIAGLLPGIQIVPSGVWAIGRAQEHGCGYCFAG
jgi:intracellular sulfur oxidation DsrE/DsrF family protein